MIERNGRRYVTVPEAAKLIERSKRTIETWIAERRLTVHYAEGRARLLDEVQLRRTLRLKDARSAHKRTILIMQERDLRHDEHA